MPSNVQCGPGDHLIEVGAGQRVPADARLPLARLQLLWLNMVTDTFLHWLGWNPGIATS